MRSLPSRVAATMVAGLLVVACTSTPTTTTPPPTPTPTAVDPTIAAVAAGRDHTCALTSGGQVSCWGSNAVGQLGIGTVSETSMPVEVTGLSSDIRAIVAGNDHTCVLTSGGRVWCWGANGAGQLGDRTATDRAVPIEVADLPGGTRAIAAGRAHTCALTNRGGIMCWGDDETDQLGSMVPGGGGPYDVVGLTSGVAAVTAGGGHTCALMLGGAVTCWGANQAGQIGDGTTTNAFIPVAVSGLSSGIAAIDAGSNHTCALTTAGGVKCWGSNYVGELGNGETTDSNVPVDVTGLASGLIAVTAGGGHACALTATGGVKCWGANHNGQVGNGSTTTSPVPGDVAGLATGVSAIAAGDVHTCALPSGGGVTCWGDNFVGQLGIGTPCDTSVPVEVGFVPLPSAPIELPGSIAHATGPKDVVLRFDSGPDVAVSDFTGELFQPGPEFTLYGDGTVIFRNERAEVLPAEGPIVRATPFMIGHLVEEQVQDLLRFALGEGGLADACERYESRDADGFGLEVFTVRAGGFDKRVEAFGENPLGPLADHLRNVDRVGRIPTGVFVPDGYWGNLLEAAPYLEGGLLPDPRDAGIVPWPWPGITPADFVTPLDPGGEAPRRVMSAVEAAVQGLSNNGGLVKRVYLLGPDGVTIYSFSLWPMLPDETS